MNAGERGLRLRLVTAARRMSALGLAHGKSGNLSARTGDGFLVTPSGMAYDAMGPGDIVAVDREGRAQGAGKPSSEWRIHRDVYARHADAAAVVHTHSFHATTLACLRRPIPAFHYEVAFAGGSDIRCSGYATFGTQELSDRALEALQGRKACLLANHGVVALGASLDEALGLAEKVEALARIYWQCLQVGEPALLDAAEMERVAQRLSTYGK
ncbi:MAG: class II aldolase/adducin family protein [Usitatibacter sp.]